MVNVLPFVARNPSLSTLKNVANRMLSVVVAELRLLTSVSGTELEKVSCIDLFAVPLGHVPTIDSLKTRFCLVEHNHLVVNGVEEWCQRAG